MPREAKMNTHKIAARAFGVLFLISFLAYGTGTGVIQSIVGAPDILSNVYASTTLIVVSALLMGVVHTVTNVGLPVVLRPVLKPLNETLYFGYLRAANYYSYNFGMVIWSLGGLMFCFILYRYKLIPRLMSVWGIVGYAVFLSGCILAIFGLDFGLIHTAPGALFEVSLSLWLIAKGFNPSAFVPDSDKTVVSERDKDRVLSLSRA